MGAAPASHACTGLLGRDQSRTAPGGACTHAGLIACMGLLHGMCSLAHSVGEWRIHMAWISVDALLDLAY